MQIYKVEGITGTCSMGTITPTYANVKFRGNAYTLDTPTKQQLEALLMPVNSPPNFDLGGAPAARVVYWKTVLANIGNPEFIPVFQEAGFKLIHKYMGSHAHPVWVMMWTMPGSEMEVVI